jgi:phospholipid transport system substrate-binding protein
MMNRANMRKIGFLLATCLAFFSTASAAKPPSPEQAAELVRETFHETTAALRQHRQQLATDPQAAKQLMRKILAPHVDFELVSRLVLARYWRTATPEQRERFIAAFRNSLLDTYALVLSENMDDVVEHLESGGQLLVMKSVRAEDARRVTVQTQMNLGDRGVSVDYQLHARNEDWNVYDVVIEGISFVASRRSEFAGLLQRQSLEQLIRQLETGT